MSELRTDLERLGERARPGQDAFERLEHRRRRKARNRRLGAGILALVLTVGGSLAAFDAFRDAGDGRTIGGGGSDGLFALWPEQTAADLAAAQERVDAGDPGSAWRADGMEVARRFAIEVLQWPDALVVHRETVGPKPYTYHFDLSVPRDASCDQIVSNATCPTSPVTIAMRSLGRQDGVWSIVEVYSEELALPLVAGEEVEGGTRISVPTNLPDGEKVSMGLAFLTACDATGIDDNVEASNGMLEFYVPAVPDACTGYVYAMLPKTGGGAVAIGSFLFTDAPARPAIGYFVEAITAIPVRFVNDVSAEVAELTCDGTGVISPSRSTVSAQADGVHIAITDSGEVPVSFTIVGAGGDGAEPGERKETVWQLPPGDATIYCGAISGGGTDASSSANLNVVDPNRLYVPAGLDCASVVGEAGSYAEGATGFSGDPVQVARDHLSGLEFDDLVERALYPESEQPVVRVVRDGAVVATVRFFDDGHGGWLVDSLGRCADTPIGSSEEPAGVSGAPVDPGVLCIDLQVPGESDNIHEGSDLHVDGRHIDFDTGCLVAPAGEPLTILFSNLDEAVQRNISIYTMTPCLRDILAEGTSQVCPPETFELPIFRGEIITGVSEIVYELGPLERGEYYFQDDVHPAANGFLIVG